jgi:hypothetical protein|tara:strand:+ start:513 stop:728 length:216 start_codon:yes stop_codon:yes gene_type:complete
MSVKRLKDLKRKREQIILAGMTSKKQLKVDKTDYQDVADCIRSDQVPASAVVEYFSDKLFYKWYKKRYLNA